jgi:cysteinyl-tRNA synthetase
MADDFNTARAMASLHDLTTEVNRSLDDDPRISEGDRRQLARAVEEVVEVFGILAEDPGPFLDTVKRGDVQVTGLSEQEIQGLIDERNRARKAKDFKRADEIRDTLKAKGIQLKDSAGGTLWEKVS